MKPSALWACMMVLILTPATAPAEEPLSPGQHARQFTTPGESGFTWRYLVHLPEGYADREGGWPVILFLHGAGERGDDLEKVKVHGPPKLAQQDKSFPFIVISPQCPTGERWNGRVKELLALLDHVEATYPVDRQRIYLTGLSMGGFGSFALAAAAPERFAAIAPICGGGDVNTAQQLKDLPMWIIHGWQDSVVPPQRSIEMALAIKAAGGRVKLTLEADAGHDSWTAPYASGDVYLWMLRHRRSLGP